MSKRKVGFGLLLLGIFFGLFTGMCLAFWLNHIGWNYSRISDLFSSPSHKEIIISDFQLAEIDTTEIEVVKPMNKKVSNKADSLKDSSEELTLEEFIELHKDEYPDSVLLNAYELSIENKTKEVSVVKDELLYIKFVDVEGLIEDDRSPDLDSILLDDRGSKNQNKKIAKIEFWKSPINYQGYKWDSRKLVLFGLYGFDFIRIKFLNDHYYMQYGTIYYHLHQRDKFFNLSLVSDNEILKQLNSI